MLKFLKEKKKDNKGFTLVELVIVVAILAILVGILAPQYTKYVEKSRKAADVSNLENLVTAFKTAASDGTDQIPAGEYKITITQSNSTLTTTGTGVTDDIDKLIASFAGSEWKNTKLKSKKWTNTQGGTDLVGDAGISATMKVENDGSIVVSYSPTWIKQLNDTNTTTTTTTPSNGGNSGQ